MLSLTKNIIKIYDLKVLMGLYFLTKSDSYSESCHRVKTCEKLFFGGQEYSDLLNIAEIILKDAGYKVIKPQGED